MASPFLTLDPETGDVFEVASQDEFASNLAAGHKELTPDQLSRVSQQREFAGLGGAAKAGLYGLVREGVPFVGDDILDFFGVDEAEQKAAIDAQPTASAIGGVAGVVGGTAALGAATGGLGALTGIRATSSLAKLASLAARGATEGVFAVAGASETRRIAGEEVDLEKSLLEGAGIGAGINLVLGGGGAALRFVGKRVKSAFKAGDDTAARVASKAAEGFAVKAVQDPIARREVKAALDSARKRARSMSVDEVRLMGPGELGAIKRRDLGSILEGSAGLSSSARERVSKAVDSIWEAEMSRKAAAADAGGIMRIVDSVGGMAVGTAIGGLVGDATAGLGAGMFFQMMIRRSGYALGSRAGNIAMKAIRPMLVVGSAAASTASASVIPATARWLTESDAEDLRDVIDNAPSAQERRTELIEAGASERQADTMVHSQDVILGALDRALPMSGSAGVDQLARANRYLEAYLDPEGVLQRMQSLQMTVEDAEITAALMPETWSEVQRLVAENDSPDYSPAVRAQRELVLGGYGIGLGTLADAYAAEPSMRVGDRKMNLGEMAGTDMQTLKL